MDNKPWNQPLNKSFVKEGQGQHDKEKQVENQQDTAKEASKEDEEVRFKPRGNDYAKAMENQGKEAAEKKAMEEQEKKVQERDAVSHDEQKNLERNAMNLQGRGWGAATHNKNTLEYDPDRKWVKPDDAEKEAWEKKRKGQGYDNR